MNSSPKSWSVRTATGKKGTYALIYGTAYNEVLPGSNPTTKVRAPSHHRPSFYYDPAVKLSESDLNEIDGAWGAPLCVEHNEADVVGHVAHSWLRDEKELQITGRIPIKDAEGRDIPRGQQIVSDIQNGHLRGFSVGYKTDITSDGELKEKTFDEISLVREPFFTGCDLTVGVYASKDSQGKNKEITK